jgi:sialate O-acetylesterase
MIKTWRDHWGQGDFPFYWVQLADFTNEQVEPQINSWWAELREAQTNTLSLPNTGQAVIIDIGEGRDIHPRNKRVVGDRLARHALAKDYDMDIASESPRIAQMEIQASAITVTFDHVSSGGLYAFDVEEVQGFAIAGADGNFKWAEARIHGKNQVVVSHPEIAEPVAVRYAWADNPLINLFDRNSLPVTPFRTDDGP